MWIVAALGSALFAGLVAILGKLGVQSTDSDVATAIRTLVVIPVAWIAAALAGSIGSISSLSPTTWVFLILSGLATGGSWICYFKALSTGPIDKVVPIDKSSAVLATLLAIALFSETANLAIKLPAIAIILAGTMMMIERRDVHASNADVSSDTQGGTASSNASAGSGVRAGSSDGSGGLARASRSWLFYAVLSAVFAALTSILGKVGIDGVESNLGTAIRTCVVLVMSWGIVFARGKGPLVRQAKGRELVFLVLSGIATGASWLCYYYAIQTGLVSVVVQLDRLSILISVFFAWIVFHERLNKKSGAGLALIVAGTIALTAFA